MPIFFNKVPIFLSTTQIQPSASWTEGRGWKEPEQRFTGFGKRRGFCLLFFSFQQLQ